ncbi:hypothetical protein AXA44_39730 [Rhodococcus sp. SC4]|nr:hypothetical protein AXA44_39730 [Rhodococcus sp. SC4]
MMSDALSDATIVGNQNRDATAGLTMAQVADFFETDSSEAPKTYVGYRYRLQCSGTRPNSAARDRDQLLRDAGMTVHAIQEQFRSLMAIHGRSKVVEKSGRVYLEEIKQVTSRLKKVGRRDELLGGVVERMHTLTVLALLSGNTHAPLTRIAKGRVLSSTRPRTNPHPLWEVFATSEPMIRERLEWASKHPDMARLWTMMQVESVLEGDFDSLLQYAGHAPDPVRWTRDTTGHDSSDEQLDFQILPPGTVLKDLAYRIARRSLVAAGAEVDLKRVGVLEKMQAFFGDEQCVFARGKSSGRGFSDSSGRNIDEDYIVLVMRHFDDAGAVVAQDALAISPIAGKHASFYVREAACHRSWREVFAHCKHDASALGARRLLFKQPHGTNPYDAMCEKVIALATCHPDDFRKPLQFLPDTKKYTLRT